MKVGDIVVLKGPEPLGVGPGSLDAGTEAEVLLIDADGVEDGAGERGIPTVIVTVYEQQAGLNNKGAMAILVVPRNLSFPLDGFEDLWEVVNDAG